MGPPNPTLSVFYSELVLSLYPILVKSVNTNIFTQILARFLVFPALAIAFGSTYDFKAIWGSPYETFVAILHNLLNLSHVTVSYLSFMNLSVGNAIALFYLYPIFNILGGALLLNEKLSLNAVVLIIIAFVGAYLIATSHKYKDDPRKQKRHNFGVIMGVLAAITETMIFLFVKSNTDAQVSPFYTINHLYPAGLAMLLGYGIYNTKAVDTSKINWSYLIGFNALLGFTGYLARFYAIPRIPTIVFSLLSFIGVAFGYIWGILFTKDEPTMKAFIGSGLIVGAIGVLRYFEIA